MLRRTSSKFYGLPICQGLTDHEKLNYYHKSTLNTFTFSQDLPRLPIPKLEKTVERYGNSLKAQVGSHISQSDVDEQLKLLNSDETQTYLQQLHQDLLAKDQANLHTSYISNDWFEMYLKDRSRLPFNVTPYLGIKRADAAVLNNPTVRATNIIISNCKFMKTLEKEWLEPELFPIAKQGPSESAWKNSRTLIKYAPSFRFTPPGNSVPLGLKTMLAYPLLKMAPLDMSQYKNLFKSTRIPHENLDEIKKFETSSHVLVMFRGRFYKLNVLDQNGDILNYTEIQKAVENIYQDAKSKPYNHDSVAWLSSMERNDWAAARKILIQNPENATSLQDIDSAIFNLVLDDTLTEELSFDVKSIDAASKIFLWGDGANRWWDKSISYILTEGGDCGLTFEHSWGDGVAVMRNCKDVFNESTNLETAAVTLEHSQAFEATEWNEITFEQSDEIKNYVKKAQSEYGAIEQDISNGAGMVEGVGKNFFKSKKLSADAIIQLAIQAAFKRANNFDTCPAYQSCSTSAFLHGRTENLRPCSLDSSAAADLLAKTTLTEADYPELIKLVRQSAKTHNVLKNDAQMGQGFDRHIFGLNNIAASTNRDLPLVFDANKNEVFKRMNHFILSTSTLDAPFCHGGGFGNVVPDGLGVGYMVQQDYMGTSVVSRKATGLVDANDFCAAFHDVVKDLEKAFASE